HNIRVEYKKSALYNDVIIPKVAREADRIVVELCDTKGKPYAVVEFK
ncbi:MAG: acyl-[acyl-carrier-protein] thioesterase, partial [Dorea sp.]